MADVFLAQDSLVNYFNEIAQSAAMLLRYRLYTGDLLRELNVPQMKFLFTIIRLLTIDFRTQSKHFATSLLRLSKTLPAFDHWSWQINTADASKQREAKTTNDSRRGGIDTSHNPSGGAISTSTTIATTTTIKRNTPPTNTIMDAQTLLTQQLAQQMRSPTLPPGITIAPVDVKLQERYIELKRVVEEKREILKHKMSLAQSMVNAYHDQSLITALRHLELAVVESTETIRQYDLALDEMSKQQEQYEKELSHYKHHQYNQQIIAPQPPEMPSAPFRLLKRPRFQQYMPDFDASLQSTNQLPNTKKMSASKRQKITRYYQNKVLIIQNILTKIGLLKHTLSFAVYRTNVLINKVLFNATSIQNIVRSLQMIVQNQHAYHPAVVPNTF